MSKDTMVKARVDISGAVVGRSKGEKFRYDCEADPHKLVALGLIEPVGKPRAQKKD